MASKTLAALLGAALLVSSVAVGQAQTQTGTGTGTGMRSGTTTTTSAPPPPSTTATTTQSNTVSTQGAKKKGFCPPGQDKKNGKGSAFNC